MKTVAFLFLLQTLAPAFNNTITTHPLKIEQSVQTLPIEGEWISENYLKEIGAKQSIYKLDASNSILAGFLISNLDNETMLHGYTHTNGEEMYTSLSFDKPANVYRTEEGLVLSLVDKNTIKVQLNGKTEIFKKVDDAFSLYRELLFSGSFKVDNKVVTLNKNGEVSNFRNFTNYTVDPHVKRGFDPIYTAESDLVYFTDAEENLSIFTFTKKDNTIILQEIKVNEEDEMETIIEKIGSPITFYKN